MINGERVLGLVVARGGSKGLPGKNVRPLAGKPLIVWTIEAALASTVLDRVVLSTDSQAIAEVARAAGCEVPFHRPDELALDRTTSDAVVDHAVGALEEQGDRYAWAVVLQPTSPFRTAADIDGAVGLCTARGATTCKSVNRPRQSPYWMVTIGEASWALPLFSNVTATRRQDLPDAYAYNGALCVVRTDWLRRTKTLTAPQMVAYVMPIERSVDIDDEADFRIAELIATMLDPIPASVSPSRAV